MRREGPHRTLIRRIRIFKLDSSLSRAVREKKIKIGISSVCTCFHDAWIPVSRLPVQESDFPDGCNTARVSTYIHLTFSVRLFFSFSTHNARVSHFYALALDQHINSLNYRHSLCIEETASWGIGFQRSCHPPRSSRGLDPGLKITAGIFSPVLATVTSPCISTISKKSRLLVQTVLSNTSGARLRMPRGKDIVYHTVYDAIGEKGDWDVAHGWMGSCLMVHTSLQSSFSS